MFFFCWPPLCVDIVFDVICGIVVVDEAVGLPADVPLEAKHDCVLQKWLKMFYLLP